MEVKTRKIVGFLIIITGSTLKLKRKLLRLVEYSVQQNYTLSTIRHQHTLFECTTVKQVKSQVDKSYSITTTEWLLVASIIASRDPSTSKPPECAHAKGSQIIAARSICVMLAFSAKCNEEVFHNMCREICERHIGSGFVAIFCQVIQDCVLE